MNMITAETITNRTDSIEDAVLALALGQLPCMYTYSQHYGVHFSIGGSLDAPRIHIDDEGRFYDLDLNAAAPDSVEETALDIIACARWLRGRLRVMPAGTLAGVNCPTDEQCRAGALGLIGAWLRVQLANGYSEAVDAPWPDYRSSEARIECARAIATAAAQVDVRAALDAAGPDDLVIGGRGAGPVTQHGAMSPLATITYDHIATLAYGAGHLGVGHLARIAADQPWAAERLAPLITAPDDAARLALMSSIDTTAPGGGEARTFEMGPAKT